MNPDYDESMITSTQDDHIHSEEDHVCTEGHVCTAPHEEESFLVAGAEPIATEAVESPQTSEVPKNTWKKYLGWIGIGVVVVIIGGLSLFVYSRPVSNPAVQKIAHVIPFPAVMVGRSFITIDQFVTERDALLKYFKTLPPDQASALPPDDQLNKMITDTLVNKLIIQTIASNLGVRLDPVQVDAYYLNILKTQKSEEDFKDQLQKTFGWNVDAFKHNIVDSIVLAKQVDEYIQTDKTMQAAQKKMIDDALTRVSNGEDFAIVATDVHTKAQINMDSDLGVMKVTVLPAEWAGNVKDLQKDQVSSVVELTGGYAIFKLTDRTKTGADTEVHLLVITVPKIGVEQTVKNYLAQVTVRQFVK